MTLPSQGGRGEPAGTVHTWRDGERYVKTGEGEWKPVQHAPKKAYRFEDHRGREHEFKVHEGAEYRVKPAKGAPGHGADDTYRVLHVRDGKAKLSRHGEYGPEMPVEAVRHFVNDQQGIVHGPPSSNKHIRAVLDQKAEFLGKGDDGLAFRDGNKVVKVSTTVPYVPENPGHLSPEAAASRLEQQTEVSEHLRRAGVPGILPTEFIRHGDKGYAIRDHVEIPERFTKEQLDQLQDSLLAMHEAGFTMNDQPQAGLLGDRPYWFDIGKASGFDKQKADQAGIYDPRRSDFENLARLYEDNGHSFEARGGVGLDQEWAHSTHRLLHRGAARRALAAAGDEQRGPAAWHRRLDRTLENKIRMTHEQEKDPEIARMLEEDFRADAKAAHENFDRELERERAQLVKALIEQAGDELEFIEADDDDEADRIAVERGLLDPEEDETDEDEPTGIEKGPPPRYLVRLRGGKVRRATPPVPLPAEAQEVQAPPNEPGPDEATP